MVELILLVILICTISKNKRNGRNNTTKRQRYTQKTRYGNSPWHSEWVWDEAKQLWVHPRSQANSENTSSAASKWENAEAPQKKDDNEIAIEFAKAYQARSLLTRNEWYQFQKLKEIADVKGYVICPKVRLFDIIEPKKGHEKYKTLMYKIQAKHVDFLICDKNMNIKAIIELDDSSHDRKERKERDAFVDLILRSVGYKVIHTRYISYDILDLV